MTSESEIKNIATLAKLKFSDAEIKEFTNQFTNILNVIKEIEQVDCSNIEPLSSVCEQQPFIRKDEVTEKDLGAALFVNAPGKDAEFAKEIKCFIVPKVVE